MPENCSAWGEIFFDSHCSILALAANPRHHTTVVGQKHTKLKHAQAHRAYTVMISYEI